MKKLVSLLLSVAVSFPLCLNAGMVVSDPASYTYYVKQLKEAQTQLKALQDQIDIATDTKDTVTRMANDVVGTYNRAKGVVDELKKVKTILAQPERVFSNVDKILELDGNPEAQFKEVDINLDKIFVDISNPDVNPWMVEKKKKIEVQKIFKDAMRSTELELAKMPQRIEAIEKLAAQIDSTENIKDSQDLTNRLIVELITGQERLIALISQLAQADVAAKYTGYDEIRAGEFKDQSIEVNSSSRMGSHLQNYLESEGAPDTASKPMSQMNRFSK